MIVSKKVAVIFGVVGLAGGVAGTIAMQTHAASSSTATSSAGQTGKQHMQRAMPAAAGSVTAINGNTITVSDKRTGTSYSVDASSAAIQKFTPPAAGAKPAAPTTITVSGIAVGDNVTVQGTVSGTNITATKIMDWSFMGSMRGGPGGFMGHGPQGAFGTVSAVNGNTITLTGKDGKTYTVDASSASVKKVVTSSVSDIAVGDTLEVSGTTTGTSITAKSITDGQIGPGK